MTNPLGSGENAMANVAGWMSIQGQIAGCQECSRLEGGVVGQPLEPAELPAPPERVDVLFVGVAPAALNGKHRGRHFWSSPTDPRRIGLFGLRRRPT